MNSIIVVSQAWPSQPYGGSIALTASLKQYEVCFDRVLYLCLNESPLAAGIGGQFSKTKFIHIPVKRGSFPKRFITSIFTGLPAITVGMGGRRVFTMIRDVIDVEQEAGGTWFGVCDDNVPSIHLPKLKSVFPDVKWAFRSHDVLHQAFSVFKREGSLAIRLAWYFEIRKIFKFERRSTQLADVNWTITEDDKFLSEQAYSTKIDGVFDSDIDLAAYEEVSSGDSRVILYLGSADQRKSHGLIQFVKNVWAQLINDTELGDVRFSLGGKRTDLFTEASECIDGRGFVDDEFSFLGEGLFFLNPQQAGSGLKLKSLIAMAAGKVLITTPNGALGLGGNAGEHYVVAESAEEMVEMLKSLFLDEGRARRIAKAGQKYVQQNFSHDALAERVQPLLRAFIGNGDEGSL